MKGENMNFLEFLTVLVIFILLVYFIAGAIKGKKSFSTIVDLKKKENEAWKQCRPKKIQGD